METIHVFVSYAREDKRWFQPDDQGGLIPWLEDSLRKLEVVFWHDENLIPGNFTSRIEQEIDKAQIAVLLVSQAFLNSHYIETTELPRIEAREEQGKCEVMPILVGRCVWKEQSFFRKFQIFPGEPTPLIKYTNNEAEWDEVRFEILEGLMKLVNHIRAAKSEPAIVAEKKSAAVAVETFARPVAPILPPPVLPSPPVVPPSHLTRDREIPEEPPVSREIAPHAAGRKVNLALAMVVVVLGLSWFGLRRDSPVNEPLSQTINKNNNTAVSTTSAIASATIPTTQQPQKLVDSAASSGNEPRAKLDTAITEIIRLLEAKDFVGFFKEFIPPDELNGLPPGVTIDQLAQIMASDPNTNQATAKTLTTLRTLIGRTPAMSKDGDTATYDTTEADGSKENVAFKKINGLWYIDDKTSPVISTPESSPTPKSTVGMSAATPDANSQTEKQAGIKAVTYNLSQLYSAAQQYMLEKNVTEARYQDLVGTGTDKQLHSVSPIMGEDYSNFHMTDTQTEITIVVPDGTSIKYDR